MSDEKLEKFMATCRNAILSRRHEQIPGVLFHYTPLDNLPFFLESDADILATHAGVLNDKDEIRTGFRLFCDALTKKFGDSDAVKQLWAHFQEVRMDPTRMPYVFSLSTDSDALPQWRAYTHQHNGGYAIGFDGRSIARAVDANMTGDAHHGWNEFFMPCVYEGIDDIQFIVDGGIEIFAEIFESYFESKKPLRNRLYEENRVIDLLVVLSSFIKNGGFVAEREWRIVVKSDFVMTEFTKNSACLNELFQPYKHSGLADSSSESALCYRSKVNPSPDREIQYSRIEIRGGKPRIKTRLKDFRLGISPLMTDITISPHGDADRLMITGLALLRSAGLHFMPQRTSHISYICR